MTMSVTITNTSNWQNEDVIVDVGVRRNVVLEPGKSMEVGVDHNPENTTSVVVRSRSGEPFKAPFHNGKKQVFPRVETIWE